jgi:hypothetical protein
VDYNSSKEQEATMASRSSSDPSAPKRMREDNATADEFLQLGLAMMQRSNSSGSSLICARRFRSHFGIPPAICAYVWDELLDPATLPAGASKKHLLWGLMFLMMYAKEAGNSSMAGGVDESTFRHWAWLFVYEVSWLEGEVVSA